MTINDLEFYLVRIECDGGQTPLQSLLVRLATDAGLEGWGEARLPWRVSELAPRRDALQPILAGRSVFDVEELLELEALDSPQLRSALEMASWDLIGRLAGQPLCRLLGGEYRERIPVAVRLPAAPDGQMTQLARELADQGFHAQIVTSCGRWQEDLETLRTVREGAGERVEWQFDAAAGVVSHHPSSVFDGSASPQSP